MNGRARQLGSDATIVLVALALLAIVLAVGGELLLDHFIR